MKKHVGIVVRGITKGGGVNRFVYNILSEFNSFSDERYEFYLIHNEQNFSGEFPYLNEVFLSQKNKFLFDFVTSKKALQHLNLDTIIYPKNVIPYTHFVLPSRKLNIVHDLGHFEKNFRMYPFLDTWFMKTFLPSSCRKSDHTFTVSQFTKHDLHRRLNIPLDKISVTHEGVEPHFRKKDSEKVRKHIEQKYSIFEPFLFYAGSFNPRKNLMRVLRAFYEIKDSIPHSLVITGINSSTNNPANKFITSYLSDRVHVVGHVPEEDLVNFYNGADIFLYPSLYEGFGLPILEAQSCGTAVITSNVTSCPEVAGYHAIKINPFSEEELATEILRVVQNEALRKTLKESGLKNAAYFSWEKTVKSLIPYF